jgi:2-hydroxycyclohexanecarboxyl-CoA dehydrogenase
MSVSGQEGRVAVVTGAGRGIGAAIAKRIGLAGSAVAVCDLDAGLAEASASAVRETGARALAVVTDVSSRASIAEAVARIESELGAITALVNNAAIDVIGPFMESDEATWDRLIAVNLKGVLLCCKAVAAGMIDRRSGRIVNIASDAGRVGSSGEAVYSATKGGVIAFTKTLARELARHGITVNCVCPGPTDTALLAQVGEYSEKLLAGLTRAIPLQRVGRPEDVAAMVAFLVGEESGYVTGQTISVNGGLTMC